MAETAMIYFETKELEMAASPAPSASEDPQAGSPRREIADCVTTHGS